MALLKIPSSTNPFTLKIARSKKMEILTIILLDFGNGKQIRILLVNRIQ
jgi:hypothetical protein